MKSSKAVGLVLMVCVLTGCSSVRRQGSSRADFLSDSVPETTSPDLMERDLVRGGSSGELDFEATPQTTAYARIKARMIVADLVYRRKLTWDKEEPLLNDFDKMAIESSRKRSCFDVRVETDYPSAADPTGWIATLEAGGKKLVGTFEKFTGFTRTTYTAYRGTVLTSSRNYYSSMICFKPLIKFAQPFTLVVEPRFRRDYRPLKLEWLEPRKL